MDLDEEDDDEMVVQRQPHIDDANGLTQTIEDVHPTKVNSSTSKTKSTNKLSVQDNNNHSNDQQQQQQQPGDEWEEFEDLKSNYEQIRLKFQRPTNDDNENDDDDYSDDENTHRNTTDENYNHLDAVDGEQSSRTNRRREQQQQKDKTVWKLDQVKDTSNNELPAEKIEEQQPAATTAPVKPATTGAYRPPQLRGNSSVSVVSVAGMGPHQRSSKKEKPNLASTEEFPTLGAAVHKK